MKLILLPAFDGTGLMYKPMMERLGDGFDAMPVAYPENGPQDYDALSDYVLEQIPKDEDYIVLGESFAGPLAYHVALKDNTHCKGAIFVATYLTNPGRAFLLFIPFMPKFLVKFLVTRKLIVSNFTLSSKASDEVATAIADNFGLHKAGAIKKRLSTIRALKQRPQKGLDIPCLYIQASEDKLVLAEKLPDYEDLCSSLVVRRADGGHFVAQENPQTCAEIVSEHFGE